ncbi:uncharacterized protein MONOS_2516 [Monocercomonoides exilis]|uniref:uncharacterized protein n=1 Tax=Monocercomonoides exilis TaxID=2049356 RepID=UPI00355AA7FB|nr:hypothetical protein MONOS_2516 [Monocercomonoides exilis]|eukprot:MONOS_2516.1-p1 / transcript=MONOS_2516.1 / gene=MONOS_2516 / organism=Monocercomonoides_exilis_PA203 / gene_product=unspecified product / transcript_product=unspecified product / location=Mono_scaffold00052:95857-98222(+) / protein_length=539 / sequence_SO=supercontig / SO=protein_coding / is_pseudo=false
MSSTSLETCSNAVLYSGCLDTETSISLKQKAMFALSQICRNSKRKYKHSRKALTTDAKEGATFDEMERDEDGSAHRGSVTFDPASGIPTFYNPRAIRNAMDSASVTEPGLIIQPSSHPVPDVGSVLLAQADIPIYERRIEEVESLLNRSLPIIIDCLTLGDSELSNYAALALKNLSDHNSTVIIDMFNNYLPALFRYLNECNSAQIELTLSKAIGNVSAFSSNSCQHLIDNGFLQSAIRLLQRESESIRKEICFICSNIAAGTKRQIKALFDSGVLSAILNLYYKRTIKAKSDCTHYVMRMLKYISESYSGAILLMSTNAMFAICEVLKNADYESVDLAMESLDNILKLYSELPGIVENVKLDMQVGESKEKGKNENESEYGIHNYGMDIEAKEDENLMSSSNVSSSSIILSPPDIMTNTVSNTFPTVLTQPSPSSQEASTTAFPQELANISLLNELFSSEKGQSNKGTDIIIGKLTEWGGVEALEDLAMGHHGRGIKETARNILSSYFDREACEVNTRNEDDLTSSDPEGIDYGQRY